MIRFLIFWVLFPFVLPQAIRLRKNAPRVSAASGPQFGTVGKGQPYRLIAIGDSIISGVGASNLTRALVGQTAQQLSEALSCKINWVARGSIGAGSRKVLQQLIPGLPGAQADIFILSVGVNDVTALSSVSIWARNLDALLGALRWHSPNAVIAVIGIPPLRGFPLLPQPLRTLLGIRGETFDMTCRRVIARHPAAIHVPLDFDPQPDRFSPDGFHPSEESYREFGRLAACQIAEKFKSAAADLAAPAASPGTARPSQP